METNLTTAILTFAYIILEGKQHWQNKNNLRVPADNVENPDPSNPQDWVYLHKKKIVLDTWRQFRVSVDRDTVTEKATKPSKKTKASVS